MMVKDSGGPAFPMPGSVDGNGNVTYPEYGMSLRDWFAGQALIAMFDPRDIGPFGERVDETARVAICAYAVADAMLEARKR
jgi:hypothetical protein